MNKFKTRYNHSSPVSPHGGVSMTARQFAADCDINTILKQFRVTGRLPDGRGDGQYIDCSKYRDFATNLQFVEDAKRMFSELPSSVRERFGHSATAFFDFVSNPDNLAECVKLGLAEVPKVEETVIDAIHGLKESIDGVIPAKENNPAS